MNLVAKLVLLSVLGTAAEAFAFPQYLEDFTGHYSTNGIDTTNLTAKESCGLCHVNRRGGGRRNAYGVDFDNVTLGQSAGFPGVEFLDSDADGFVNLEEIYLQTSPSDAANAPLGRIELSFNPTASEVTAKSGACANLQLKAFGFTFAGGVSEATFAGVNGETKVPVIGASGAVLAQCAAESFVGSLTVKP